MTAHYRTLYQCCKCQGVLDLNSETLESTSCACGAITIKQKQKTLQGATLTSVHVKPLDMQLADPGPYLRRALA
jgi:hypothetical protein